MYIYIYTHVYRYIYMYIYMYIHAYAHIYICKSMFVYIASFEVMQKQRGVGGCSSLHYEDT